MGPGAHARHTFVKKLFDAGVLVHVNGRGMSQASHLQQQYAAAVIADNFLWRALLIMQGTNDYAVSRTIEEFEAGYAGFIDDVMAAPTYGAISQVIVCITPFQRANEDTPNLQGYTLEDLRQQIRDICSARDLPVWEGTDILPPEPNLVSGQPSKYFNDGLHPNKRGHRLIARKLVAGLIDYFKN